MPTIYLRIVGFNNVMVYICVHIQRCDSVLHDTDSLDTNAIVNTCRRFIAILFGAFQSNESAKGAEYTLR